MTRTPDTSRAQDWATASLWARSLPSETCPSLRSDASVDVVVIGAGITGLLTALLAADNGAEVLVVDRHGVGGVATRNTTAKVSALQGTMYRAITGHRNAEAAEAYAAAQL